MARPKKLRQVFTLPANPDYIAQAGQQLYDTRYMSVDELAARLFAVDAYPDCATVGFVKKNIENHCRRGNIPCVQMLPGLPTERISRHRAPWCVERAAALDWVARATQESIARKESARQKA